MKFIFISLGLHTLIYFLLLYRPLFLKKRPIIAPHPTQKITLLQEVNIISQPQSPSSLPVNSPETSDNKNISSSSLFKKQEVKNIRKNKVSKLIITQNKIPSHLSNKSNAVWASYENQLRLWIDKNLTYPQRAHKLKLSGNLNIQFSILSSGKIIDVQLIKPSPYKVLNDSAITTLKKLKFFKPLPLTSKKFRQFTIPIIYKYRP